jgi:hypothetical protein
MSTIRDLERRIETLKRAVLRLVAYAPAHAHDARCATQRPNVKGLPPNVCDCWLSDVYEIVRSA